MERYIIEEMTPEDLEKNLKNFPNSKAMVKLVETGYMPATMGFYETKEAAEKSKAEWTARDELSDDIGNFLHDIVSKYHGRLSDDEIQGMIKEY